MRRAAWALAALVFLLGCGHLAFLAAAPAWAPDVLWFAGTGLAILLGALLNMAALRGDRTAHRIAAAGDLLAAGFFAAALTLLRQPQVLVGALLFAGLAVGMLTVRPVVRA